MTHNPDDDRYVTDHDTYMSVASMKKVLQELGHTKEEVENAFDSIE